MFFVIGGIQPKTILLDKQPRSCPSCGRLQVHLKRTDQFVSLFFIPLLRVKKGTPLAVCDNCGALFDESGIPIEDLHTQAVRRCPHCGRAVGADFIYCPYCGKSVR